MTAAERNDDLPDFELPDLPEFDHDAMRRVVRRGVLRVAFTAAAWLLLAAVIAVIATGTVTALRSRPFAAVVNEGIVAAHPEFEFHGMSCCGGLTSVVVQYDGHVRGDVDGAGQAAVEVRLSLLGEVDVQAGDPTQTPVRRALSRGPATKAATRTLLAKLPDTVVASAVVELEQPLPYDRIKTLTSAQTSAVILTAPFGNDPLVGWPAEGNLDRFASWAGDLRADDDELLAALDLPPSVTLREMARDPQVHALIVDRATPKQLRSLLDNPAIRGVNLADIAFDPAAQAEQ